MIPDGCVATKIIAEIAVMMVVEGRRDKPFGRPVPVPPAREKFMAGVNINAHDDIGRSDQHHGLLMDRDRRQEQGNKAPVDQRFDRADGQGGQGIGRGRIVMDLVDIFIHRFLVHPAVQPVEPGVKGKEIERIFQRHHPPGNRTGTGFDKAAADEISRQSAEYQSGNDEINDRKKSFVAERLPLEPPARWQRRTRSPETMPATAKRCCFRP